MAEEFSELKLQVSFVDNASAQLKALVGEVNKLGDLSSGASRGFRDMTDSANRFGGELKKVAGLLGDITKLPVGSLLGAGGLAGIAYGIKSINDSLASFSREMINLQNSSRAAGVLPDQFKNLSEQLTQVGYSAAEADSELVSFFKTINEASRPGTQQAERIWREAFNPTVMMENVRKFRDMINRGEGARALQEAAREGNAIFERELNKPGGNLAEATRQREAYFESLGLSGKAANLRQLIDVVGSDDKWQRRINAAIAWNKEYEKMNKTTEEIGTEVKMVLLPAFEDLNTWLVKNREYWEKWIPERVKIELETIVKLVKILSGDFKGFADMGGVRPGSLADRLIRGRGGEPQGPPTPFGEGPKDPRGGQTLWPVIPAPPVSDEIPGGGRLSPEQTERLQRRYRGRTRQRGGPVTGGQPYIVGERGPELFVPRSSGTVVASLGDVSDRKEAVEEETDQRRALTTNLKQINDMLENTDIDLARAGTGAGAGWGYGRAGVPGYAPGGGTSGDRTPGGTTTDNRPAGPFPPGTHGGPGGPPITPYAPGGTQPATLPGSRASTGYPTGGGFTPVPDLTTASGQRPGGGASTTAGQVSGATDQAIVDAAAQHGIDPNFFRSIADIESSSNPGSNRNAKTQYKGLFQMNQEEFQKHGGGDIYNARDNANAAAKLFAANRDWFTQKYGRAPTDGEMYLMHLQGRGFFTSGTLTNVAGNPYPGMKGPQTPETFLKGWSERVERGKQAAIQRSGATTVAAPAATPSLTTLKTRPAAPGQGPAVTADLLSPNRMAPPTATAGGGNLGGTVRLGETGAHGYQRGGVQTEAWLVDTVRQASKVLPPGYRAEVISTVDPRTTGTPWHPSGRAIDIQIYDDKGNKVPYIGDRRTPGYDIYARMAAAAKIYAGDNYPKATFTWGGHFHSGTPYDRMHFQSGGVSAEQFSPQELQRARADIDALKQSQVAGPGAGTSGGPKIQTLSVKPDPNLSGFNPFGDQPTTRTSDGDYDPLGGKAAGKGLPPPYLGGRAAGKGKLIPWGSQGSTAAEENEQQGRPFWQLDRASLDRAQGGSASRRVRGKASVDVTVKKSEDARSTPIKGPFKKIPMPRVRQHEPASTGAPEPTAADHDPGLDS